MPWPNEAWPNEAWPNDLVNFPVSATASSKQESRAGILQTRLTPFESKGPIVQTRVTADEFTSHIINTKVTPQESRKSALNTRVSPEESKGLIIGTRLTPEESGTAVGAISQVRVTPEENVQKLAITKVSPEESRAGIIKTQITSQNSRGNPSASKTHPQESKGLLPVTRTTPEASIQKLSITKLFQEESRAGIIKAVTTSQNSRGNLSPSKTHAQENKGPLSVTRLTPHESSGRLAVTKIIPQASRLLVTQTRKGNQESRSTSVSVSLRIHQQASVVGVSQTKVHRQASLGHKISARTTPQMFRGPAGPLITKTAARFNVRIDKPNLVAQQVLIYNDGVGTLHWTATSDATWLTFSPSTGTVLQNGTPSTLQVFTDKTGLTEGTYVGHVSITGSGTVVVTVTFGVFAVQTAAYVPSRFPSMVTVSYPLVPPRPAIPILDVTNFTAPTITFALPPDTRDLFGILIQGKRTLVGGPITLASDGADDRFMLVSGQDALGNYMEERIQLNGTAAVTTVKSFNWILWVNSTYGTVLNEVPTPLPNGATTTFTVSKFAIPHSMTIYLNGLVLVETTAILPGDYIQTGNTFTLTVAPATGFLLQVSYIYEVVTNRAVSINGGLGSIPAGALQWLANPILYRYEDLSFGGDANDPALTYTVDNAEFLPEQQIYAYFYNLLDELSRPLDYLANFDEAVNCLDVRKFGAICDGVTNDTAAVQLAIDTANANYLHEVIGSPPTGSPPLLTLPLVGSPIGSPPVFGPTIVCIHSGCNALVGGHKPVGQLTQNGKDVTAYALNLKAGVTLLVDGQLTLLTPVDGTYTQGLVSTYGEHDVAIIGEGILDANGSTITGANVGAFIDLEGYNLAIGGTLTIQNTNGIGATSPAIRMVLHLPNKKSDISNCKIIGPGFAGGILVGAETNVTGLASTSTTAQGLMIDTVVIHEAVGGPGIIGICSAWTIQNCDILDASGGIIVEGGNRIIIANNKIRQTNAIGSPAGVVTGSGGPGIELAILAAVAGVGSPATMGAPGSIIGCRVYANHVDGMIGGGDATRGTGIVVFVPAIAGDSSGFYMAAIEVSSNVSNDNDAYGIRIIDVGGFGNTYEQINLHDNSASHNGIADIPDPVVGGIPVGLSTVSVDVTGNAMLVKGLPYQFFGYGVQHWSVGGVFGVFPNGYVGPFTLFHIPVPFSVVVRQTTIMNVVQSGPITIPGSPPTQQGAGATPMTISLFRDDFTVSGYDITFSGPIDGDVWITYRYIL
jgi:Viral BACON domain